MIRCERGQALIEYAILFPVMIIFGALIFFAGFTTVELNRLQGAATAAATAGAQELPDQVEAYNQARAFAAKNGYTEGVTVNIMEWEVEVIIENQLDYILPIPIDSPMLTGRHVHPGSGE